jgi:hypothetical protein
LQLDQLALQAKQFLKIEPPVDGPFGAVLGKQLGESLIVEFHLELFIDAVEHFAAEAVVERMLIFAVRAHLDR